MADKWMQGAVKRPGQLHRDLGVPQGKKIPAKKIHEAIQGEYGKAVRRRAVLARTFSKHRGG